MKNKGKVCDVRSLTIHRNISEMVFWIMDKHWLLTGPGSVENSIQADQAVQPPRLQGTEDGSNQNQNSAWHLPYPSSSHQRSV